MVSSYPFSILIYFYSLVLRFFHSHEFVGRCALPKEEAKRTILLKYFVYIFSISINNIDVYIIYKCTCVSVCVCLFNIDIVANLRSNSCWLTTVVCTCIRQTVRNPYKFALFSPTIGPTSMIENKKLLKKNRDRNEISLVKFMNIIIKAMARQPKYDNNI